MRICLGFILAFTTTIVSANPLTSSQGYTPEQRSSDSLTLEASRSSYEKDMSELLDQLYSPNTTTDTKVVNIVALTIWEKMQASLSVSELKSLIESRTYSPIVTLASDVVRNEEERLRQNGTTNPCFQKDQPWLSRYFCTGVFRYNAEITGFGGAGIGLNGENNSLKLKVWQMDLGVSDNVTIPFNIYIADVDSTTDPEDANRAKLLDLEQGKLNLMLSKVVKYRINEFCNFTERGGKGCYLGIQGGFRYSEFEASDNGTTEEKKGAIGAYAKLGTNIILPLYDTTKVGAGTLSVSLGYVHYYQNLGDSSILFPSITDPTGNPLAFDKEYKAGHFSMELNITNQLVVRAMHYEPISNDQLTSTTLMEFSFSPKEGG